MKLSCNWLKDYLKCDLSPARIAEAMTAIGIEVDSLQQASAAFSGVVVAEVLTCGPHPDSDHLHITTVNDGSDEPVQVVCGAPNVAAGQKVLFARLGAELPGDFKIKKSKIRGVESFGMICAEDELGIGSSHAGIMVLPEDATVGMDAVQYLGIKPDAVIEYEITANRVDAASHWGVARDLYAWCRLNGVPCKLEKPLVDAFAEGPQDAMPIELVSPDGAPRYTGILVRGVKVGPSPAWLQERLNAIGSRPINNIVDISNFILFELGQPLHTFDADKITGGKVVVRRASEGEKIVTLDGIERTLSADDMVIANSDAPMCIAGVFGGEGSSVTEDTRDVFIESAYFDPGSIRKTSKRHTLQTDASFRYERGCDPQICLYALKRAALLVKECAGGEIAGKISQQYPAVIERRKIELDYERIENFIGFHIGFDKIESILSDLCYEFVQKTSKGAVVLAPSYMVDVSRECDVVEEILRIYGYDNIPLPRHMKMSVCATPSPDPEAVRGSISNFLASNGFAEIMNNSLTKGAYYENLKAFPPEKCVRIINPLSQDLNVMRQTLIPGGLEVVAYNLNRQIGAMKLFEYGSVYSRNPQKSGENLEGYEEHQCFALLTTGCGEKSWRSAQQKSDYFQLKGYIELLLKKYGVDIYQMWTLPAASDIFEEGMQFTLPGQQTKVLLTMGTVSQTLSRKFGIKQKVYAAEINWQVLFELVRRDKVAFRELPRFPEVRRDLALLLDEGVSFADLRTTAFRQAKKFLTSVILFDVYRGDKIPEGKKQYALGFTFRDTEKTLTDRDVENIMTKLLDAYRNQFGAALR